MAKARLVVADQSSLEIDQMRATLNALVKALEGVATAIDGGDDAETALEALGALITSGEIVGIKPTPEHPPRPGSQGPLVDL